MEGKEHMNEDDELNPNSNNEGSSDADSDNFGLPDYSEPEDTPSEDKVEEDDYSVGEPYSSESWEGEKQEESTESYSYSTDEEFESTMGDESETAAGYENEYESTDGTFDDTGTSSEEEYSKDEIIQNAHEEEIYEQKKSPVIWIILMIIIVIGLGIGLFWWINREEPAKVVTKRKQPAKVEQPVVSTPEPEPETPEPVTTDNSFDNNLSGNLTVGQIIDITTPTGQYYVIIASAIDDDLLRDYAKKLVTNGYGCAVLAPAGKTKFSRLAVAEYASLNDAALKSEELKGEFGDKVWVKKY